MKSRSLIISIVLAILFIVGVGACYQFFIRIRGSMQEAYQAESRALESSVRERQQASLETLLQEIKPDFDVVSSRLLSTDGSVSFIERIEELGRLSGALASIDSVSEKGGDEASGTNYLDLGISAQGTWVNVYTFLRMLESLPYKVSINSVVFSRSASEVIQDKKTKATVVNSKWRGTFSLQVLKKK